ncbi:hypothetical protein [Sideroxyarcus sp. TK5]
MKIGLWGASITLSISLLLAGCAMSSAPPPADAMRADIAGYQLPRLPAAGKALVYVVFVEAWYGSVGFDVFLDGQTPAYAVGRNSGGQYFHFELEPGEHRIFSKGEKWAELPITVKAGDVVFIRQELQMGTMEARVVLVPLDELEGKYYVSKLKPGQAFAALEAGAPLPQGTERSLSAGEVFTGKVTGGNLAKGVGYSNINIKLLVTPEGGEPETFFVRSDSKVYDASGRPLDYQEAFKTYGKRVEIRHFVIRDATGGQPGRTDFEYEIGHKGVREMRILDQ